MQPCCWRAAHPSRRKRLVRAARIVARGGAWPTSHRGAIGPLALNCPAQHRAQNRPSAQPKMGKPRPAATRGGLFLVILQDRRKCLGRGSELSLTSGLAQACEVRPPASQTGGAMRRQQYCSRLCPELSDFDGTLLVTAGVERPPLCFEKAQPQLLPRKLPWGVRCRLLARVVEPGISHPFLSSMID